MNAADIQDRARPGNESFLDRMRQFGGGVFRVADAYWSGRSGDVDARLQYHADEGNGAPNLFIDGSLPEFLRPGILGRMEGQIPQATGDVVGHREDAARRFQAVQDYSMSVRQFPHSRLEPYVKEVRIPAFGAKHFWYRYEFTKSRSQIRPHMFAI